MNFPSGRYFCCNFNYLNSFFWEELWRDIVDDARLRAALGYRRFARAPRVLVFDTEYHVVADAVDGALDLGWQVQTLPAPKRGLGDNQFVASLLTALVTFQPDFVLTVNHLGFDEKGVLAQLLERYQIPVASWFVDHPMPILGGAEANATTNLQVFCFERTAFGWLQKNGYSQPVYLPTGANQRYFDKEKVNTQLAASLRCGVSFAGNSWWYKTRVEPSKAVRKAARALAAKQPVLRHTVADALEKILEKGDRPAFAAAQVALAEASLHSRQQFVNRLREVDVKLVGDAYWKNICPGIQVSPYLEYHTGLPALFVASDVNMNITSMQMPTAVNQRVWDVPGVGGFLLTDDQEDGRMVFTDGVSGAFYSSLDEAISKVRYYLAHPAERARIALAANDIVNKGHRMTHRMQTMYDAMKRRFL